MISLDIYIMYMKYFHDISGYPILSHGKSLIEAESSTLSPRNADIAQWGEIGGVT